MGVKCQIIRDRKSQEIISVEAPNGDMSILYNDLNSTFRNPEKALEAWAYTYTPEFKEIESSIPLDVNGEPFAIDVIKHLNQLNMSKKNMTSEDMLDFIVSFNSLPIKDFSSLQNRLTMSFFENGIFTIDEQKLIDGGLYTTEEIRMIVSSKKVQDNIKSSIEKLQGYTLNNETIPTELKEAISVSSVNGMFMVSDGISNFGKFKKTKDAEPYLNSILVGTTSEEDFYDAVMALPEEYAEIKYQFSDENYRKEMMEYFQSKSNVDVLVLDENGELVQDLENDTLKLLFNTLKANIFTPRITNAITLLSELSPEVYQSSEKEIKTILKEVTLEAEKIGLDLQKLEESFEYKSQLDVTAFIESLNEFTTALALNDISGIEEFSEVYNEYFGISPKPAFKTIENTDLNLVFVKNPLTEAEMFNRHSMVRAYDNFYQRVDKESISDENLQDMILEDSTVFPKEAYYPTAYTSESKFDENILQNNLQEVIADVKRHAAKIADRINIPLEAALFKLAFRHPIEKVLPKQDLLKQATIRKEAPTNMEYLTGEFISDFYINMLEHKRKNTPLYSLALQHFNIDENGITLNTTDVKVKKMIASVLPKNGVYKSLRDYTKVSKDGNLNSLFPQEISTEVEIPSIPFMKDFYLNNPTLLKEFKGEYTSDMGTVSIPNIQDNFVRIKNELYERVDEGKYKKIEGSVNSLFNIYNVFGKDSLGEVTPNLPSTFEKSTVKVKKLPKEQQEEILNVIDRC